MHARTHARSSPRTIPRVIPTCSLKSLLFICLSLTRWLQVLIHQSNLSHRTPSGNEWVEPIQLPPPAYTLKSALPAGETTLKTAALPLLHFTCAARALWLDTCLLGGSNVNRSLGRQSHCLVDSWLHHLDKLIVTPRYEAFGKELQLIWTKLCLLAVYRCVSDLSREVTKWCRRKHQGARAHSAHWRARLLSLSVCNDYDRMVHGWLCSMT